MLNVDWASYTDEISRAALVTLEFAAAGFAGAVVLGLLVALLRRSKYRLVRMPLSIYVEASRTLRFSRRSSSCTLALRRSASSSVHFSLGR